MTRKTHRPISREEDAAINAIVARALAFFPGHDESDIKMDLIACHLTNPLRLDDLLAAPDGSFVHDIAGINRHLDHRTFQLQDCFRPRYSVP